MTRARKGEDSELRAAALAVVRAQEEHSLQNWGGWPGWYGAVPQEVERHLRLRKALGLKIPAQLAELAKGLR